MKKIVLFCMAIGFLCTSHVFAASTFTEDFEGGSLIKWSTIGSGVIVDDPYDSVGPINQVLNFTTHASGGDIFTAAVFSAGEYTIKFDYLGDNGSAIAGGYVGLDYVSGSAEAEQWLYSYAGSGGIGGLVDDGSWGSYDLTFTADYAFQLKLEDFVAPGLNVYFDDFDMAAVPVPAAVWLLGSGLLGLAGFRRKQNA